MKVSTECSGLDALLRGGIESGIITEVYGAAGSGKTSFCLQMCRNKKSIFIDTEGVSAERLKQVCGEKPKINFYRVSSFEEQHKAILKTGVEKPELVVVDSIVLLYRLLRDNDNATKLNQKLNKQMYFLSELAHELDIPVIVTSQVYTRFGQDKIEPAGGDIMKYWPKCIIALENSSSTQRKAILVKHRSLGKNSCTFKITNNGLE